MKIKAWGPLVALLALIAAPSIYLIAQYPQQQTPRVKIEQKAPHGVGGESQPQQHIPTENSTGQPKANSGGEHAENFEIWGVKRGEWLLFLATLGLWYATWRLVTGADDTAKRQLRAYVAVTEIVMNEFRHADVMGANGIFAGPVHSYRISAKIENTGQTPTRRAIVNINWEARDDDLPDDFAFSDGESEVAAIGARSSYHTPGFFISIAEIQRGIARHRRVFVWGWVDYDDVFENSKRHRTEFCFEIVADIHGDRSKIYMRFPSHRKFNGIDADCVRTPAPYAEPRRRYTAT